PRAIVSLALRVAARCAAGGRIDASPGADAVELANFVRGGTRPPDPMAIEVGLIPVGHARERIVVGGEALSLGILPGGELPQGIEGVVPCAKVGIGGGNCKGGYTVLDRPAPERIARAIGRLGVATRRIVAEGDR